jgi:hypothetical protein
MAAADQIFGFNAGANHDVISHGTLVLASNDGIGAALAFAAATPVNFNAGSLNFASTALKTATVVDVQTQLSGDFTTVAGIKSGVDSFLTAAAFDPAKTFKGLVELHDTAGNEAVLYVNHVAAATAAVTEVSLVGVLHGTTGNLAASNFA